MCHGQATMVWWNSPFLYGNIFPQTKVVNFSVFLVSIATYAMTALRLAWPCSWPRAFLHQTVIRQFYLCIAVCIGRSRPYRPPGFYCYFCTFCLSCQKAMDPDRLNVGLDIPGWPGHHLALYCCISYLPRLVDSCTCMPLTPICTHWVIFWVFFLLFLYPSQPHRTVQSVRPRMQSFADTDVWNLWKLGSGAYQYKSQPFCQ